MPNDVQHTIDLERVRALPRRRIDKRVAEAWAAKLTPIFRVPGSSAELRPWQALSLAEVVENRGGLLGLPVGQGKTLVVELAAVALQAKRPILIVPANLRDKTYGDRAELQRDWRLANPPPRLVSREELALASNALLLDQIRPDLILIDEGDQLANGDSAAAKRIDRYIVKHPDVIVVVLTGTLSRTSIMGYWHLLCWALRERAPVPMRQGEADMWALALDSKGPRGSRSGQMGPGALGATQDAARRWYAARLAETPGVVIVDEDSAAGVPLTVRVRLAHECPILDEHFRNFLLTQTNPDGHPVSDPLSRWRIDGQLGCGHYTKWDPPPPLEWRDARLMFARFVRARIEQSAGGRKPLDTEAQVVRAFPEHEDVRTWLDVRDEYDPEANSVTVWLSDATIDTAIAWLAESPEPGIIWSGSVPFAERLTARTRLPYYGRQGKDQHGRGLHAAPVENIIASWHANKLGFNLQPWTRQLIVHPPQSAKWFEQIFGRSHRAGQTQPVTVDVLATSGGTVDSFEAALDEASFVRATVGMTQKISRARVQRSHPRVTEGNKFRWASRTELREDSIAL